MLEQIDNNKPLVGVAVGNGRSAKQAYEGGADMILALNAGRFRMAGLPSIASFLPSTNSNQLVFDFANSEIIPLLKNIPIIFGACAQDYNYTHEQLIDLILKNGYSGINNFPTVSLIDGVYREYLEENDEGYIKEVQLMKEAVHKGLFTVAFAVTKEEAIQMSSIGVDIVCLHFGWTYSKQTQNEEYLEKLIEKTKDIINSVKMINKDLIMMVYGGSAIIKPDVMSKFFKETNINGYIGGSVFEIFPVENSIKEATRRFKYMNHIEKLEEENKKLRESLLSRSGVKNILGESEEIKKLTNLIAKIASYDNNILISGELGSGKDLTAKAIHYNSQRAVKPFVRVTLSVIPKDNVEKVLFGEEKDGNIYKGKFEEANGGTLLLDNINELDLNTQNKLATIINEAKFMRLSGNESIPVDVRIIATTSEDLLKLIKEKKFRDDLYYLINVLSVETPPLRKHKQDIPIYVDLFLERLNEKNHRKIVISEEVMYAFMEYDWPGNIRELKNVLERCFVLCEDEYIDISCLPISFGKVIPSNISVNYIKKSSDIIEKELLLNELNKANWNQTKVAFKLNISRRTLYNKIKKYNLEKSEK